MKSQSRLNIHCYFIIFFCLQNKASTCFYNRFQNPLCFAVCAGIFFFHVSQFDIFPPKTTALNEAIVHFTHAASIARPPQKTRDDPTNSTTEKQMYVFYWRVENTFLSMLSKVFAGFCFLWQQWRNNNVQKNLCWQNVAVQFMYICN